MSKNHIPDWAKTMKCGITVCNAEGIIIYMNERAVEMKHSNLVGRDVMLCHNPHSQEIIRHLLAEGGQHVYTIEKDGMRKLLYQSSWLDEDGKVGGLCEIMAFLDGEIPHFVRH